VQSAPAAVTVARVDVRRLRAIDSYRDVAASAALAALGLCELAFPALRADFHGPKALNALLVILIALPVAWRRRAPVAALVVYWIPAQIWLDAVYDARSSLPLEPFVVLLSLVYTAAVFAETDARTIVHASSRISRRRSPARPSPPNAIASRASCTT
jgi:hypothetical protein